MLPSLIPVLLLLPVSFSYPTRNVRRAVTPIRDGSAVNGQTYDYVIAGGGLSGSVLARRLAEGGQRRVLVIESGYDQEGNTDVTSAEKYGSTFGTDLDFAYKTTPQAPNSEVQTVRAGRALGGSTCINGMAWSKPHTFQIDAMETVGNPGLNWASLEKYMLMVESFSPPSSSQYSDGVTYNPSCRGNGGPVKTEYVPDVSPANLEHNFNTTVQGLGLPYAFDLTCGNPAGLAPISDTRSQGIRSDAYRSYLYQQDIPNLTILTGANVGRVILSNTTPPKATGVEFRDEHNNDYTVSAGLEVVMATGSIKTPVILQQSGIGPASVLNNAGVPVKVDLPVGLNLIDQTTSTTNWNFRGANGGDQPITFPRFQDLFTGSDAENMRNMLQNDLGTYAQAAQDAGAVSNATALQAVLEIQRDWILNQGAGISENFDYSYSNVLGYDSWYLLPFGRGSIKIQDNQPYNNNTNIDPRYFTTEFDRLAQGATVRFTRTVSSTSPLSNDVTRETTPGGSVPNGASLDEWATWAQNNYRSNWHPIGTASMMSQDMGGVVNSNHQVYGVNNLRVVDGSLLPFQVSSHLMTVLYGLAERAADIIKQAHSGPITSSSSSSSASKTSSSSSSSSTAPPTVTGKAIHPNGNNAKCLEVVGTVSNGAAVEINDCNTSNNNQKWTLNKATTAVKVAGSNYCLDAGLSPGDGTKMKVWQCYQGVSQQTWYYTDDNRIALQGQGQCLDLTDGSTNNGNIVQIWSCSTGNNNQVWTTT